MEESPPPEAAVGEQLPPDHSILNERLGYERTEGPEPVVVCADANERNFLLAQQRKYRSAPILVLGRLREARAQLSLLDANYKLIAQSEQDEFAKAVRAELQLIEQQLADITSIERPAVNPTGKKLRDARNGAILQMIEAASLGMPLEVWKTRMGRFRDESTITALRNIYLRAGGGFAGVSAFWAGTSAKMVESGTKGAVLMFSKEFIKDNALASGISPSMAGFIAGAGGGVCQVSVMGPCTFLVTSVVTGDKSKTLTQHVRETWSKHGIKGFYSGGWAIAARQASNWASRQGFTDAIREIIKRHDNPDNPATVKLTVREEVLAGMIGGAISCWNHPFEVARIEAQARAAAGEPKIGMFAIFKQVTSQYGIPGLFKGVIPRIMLGIYQTVFMVTGANLIRHHLLHADNDGGRH